MPTPEKAEVVEELKQRIQQSPLVILTQYIGINVEQVTDLRRQLREAGVEFKVYKNTLAKRALDGLELSEVLQFVEGPTAWAFSEDAVSAAKVLKEFAKEVPVVAMRGGLLNGDIVTQSQLESLAALPSREVLIAQVVGTVAAPLRNLVFVLSAPQRNLVNVLDQIRKQKEESGAAAA